MSVYTDKSKYFLSNFIVLEEKPIMESNHRQKAIWEKPQITTEYQKFTEHLLWGKQPSRPH